MGSRRTKAQLTHDKGCAQSKRMGWLCHGHSPSDHGCTRLNLGRTKAELKHYSPNSRDYVRILSHAHGCGSGSECEACSGFLHQLSSGLLDVHLHTPRLQTMDLSLSIVHQQGIAISQSTGGTQTATDPRSRFASDLLWLQDTSNKNISV